MRVCSGISKNDHTTVCISPAKLFIADNVYRTITPVIPCFCVISRFVDPPFIFFCVALGSIHKYHSMIEGVLKGSIPLWTFRCDPGAPAYPLIIYFFQINAVIFIMVVYEIPASCQ